MNYLRQEFGTNPNLKRGDSNIRILYFFYVQLCRSLFHLRSVQYCEAVIAIRYVIGFGYYYRCN